MRVLAGIVTGVICVLHTTSQPDVRHVLASRPVKSRKAPLGQSFEYVLFGQGQQRIRLVPSRQRKCCDTNSARSVHNVGQVFRPVSS